jgi:hypothetical protein
MSNGPLFKRPVSLRRKPGPQPPAPSRDELFREAYMAALQGCCAQYEAPGLPGHKPLFTGGDTELMRARQIVRRAWNCAAFTCQAFEISAFDEEVGAP